MARGFSASTDEILSPDLAATRPTGAQSHSIWVYFTSVAARADFFNIWHTSGNHAIWLLSNINAGGGQHFNYYLYDNANAAHNVDSGITPSINTWYHVCGTWDGTNQRIYINGVLKQSGTPTMGGGGLKQPGTFEGIRCGGSGDNPTSMLGRLCDGALFNFALTAGEVNALALGKRPNKIRSGPFYWIPLDGLQSPEPDFGGNANNGVVTGTTFVVGPPIDLFTSKTIALMGAPPVVPLPGLGIQGMASCEYHHPPVARDIALDHRWRRWRSDHDRSGH